MTVAPSPQGFLSMSRLFKIALAAAAVSAIAAPAMAQSSATASTTASATIVQPITLTKNSDLAFGTVVKPTSGTNTITINETSGSRSMTGAGDAALATSTTSRAAYSVGGEGGQTFSITVPATATITRSGGSETLTVNLVKTAATGTISGSIGSAGTASFGVGGNFDVSSTTVSGAYSGSFNTTVAYN
jgi:hypothetical protein